MSKEPGELEERHENRIVQIILKLLLLIIVPVLVGVLVIGGALQIIGVPVLATTSQYIREWTGHAGQSLAVTSQGATNLDKTQLKETQAQLASANAKLQSDSQQIQQLKEQLKQADAQANNASQAQQIAKTEASILAKMDPGAAAQVLDKLPTDQAAAVVAELGPTDSSQILAGMDAAKAATLLAKASTIPTNSTNSTSP